MVSKKEIGPLIKNGYYFLEYMHMEKNGQSFPNSSKEELKIH